MIFFSAPGVYTLFVWDEIDAANLYDADFIRRFEAQGRPLHVNESSTQNVDLVAIPNAY